MFQSLFTRFPRRKPVDFSQSQLFLVNASEIGEFFEYAGVTILASPDARFEIGRFG
jgi:hypothetical protein